MATVAGFTSSGNVNGLGTVARFNNLAGIVVDLEGNVLVADTSNHLIRKIDSTGKHFAAETLNFIAKFHL